MAEPYRASDLKHGPGSPLWAYWTKGPGLAKWSGAVHKWTTLRDLLLAEGVPPGQADGLATNIIMAVMPGYMKKAHAGKGRAVLDVSEPDRAGSPKPYGNVKYADPKNGKYPIDTAEHAKAAWSYVNMPKNAAQYPMNGVTLAEVKQRIMAACKKFGIEVSESKAQPPDGLDVIRTGPGLELRPEGDAIGVLAGRFTEFGRWYRVRSVFEGDFMERTLPGATLDTIREDRDGMRVLFDHGMDHAIGNKVLGPIEVLEEKDDGPRYEVPLFDTTYNRDLVPGLRAGVYGASMRMRVLGDDWDDKPQRSDYNPDGIKERTITRMRVMEFGPVTFPANPGATAGMRSATDDFYYRLAERSPEAFAGAVRAAGLSPEDFTGLAGARSAPGREAGAQPGHGRAPHDRVTRDRALALRLRGIR